VTTLLRLGALSVVLAACSGVAPPDTSSTSSGALETSSVRFNVPDCLASGCTSSDQTRLTASSAIEADYVAAIDGARESLDFAMFTFSRKPIFDALVRAAGRGVTVRGVLDRRTFQQTAPFCKPTGCTLPAPFDAPEYTGASLERRLELAAGEPLFAQGTVVDKLAILLTGLGESGVRPAPGADRLVHDKFALADGRLLLTGSGNWSSTAVSINLENVLRVEASDGDGVVGAFRCAFGLLWTGDGNRISSGMARCQAGKDVYFTPSSGPGTDVAARIGAAIAEAQASIDVSMHHLTHPALLTALEAAAARGVRVRLLFDDDDCNASMTPALEAVLAAGAEARFAPTACKLFQLSHSKYGVFDGALVINGSGNWSKAGLRSNYENFIARREQGMASAFADNFASLWTVASSREACACDVTTPECQARYCLSTPTPE